MTTKKNNKNDLLLPIMWLLEGIFVGVGAILPGISGGTLLVAFGMYRPIIEVLSNLKQGFKKHWFMLGVFVLGIGIGFVGLSGIAAALLNANTALVVCAFAGFIMGTFPELWADAGEQGRSQKSYLSLGVCFVVMIVLLTLFKTQINVAVSADFWGYLLCGVLWGLSLIVPGLSSSSLLLLFGLYQPMLEGISAMDFSVLIPMGIGMLACILSLSKVISIAYKKHFSIVSHGVLGIVVATAIMIIPFDTQGLGPWSLNLLCIVGGALVSYGFTILCNKLKANAEEKD